MHTMNIYSVSIYSIYCSQFTAVCISLLTSRLNCIEHSVRLIGIFSVTIFCLFLCVWICSLSLCHCIVSSHPMYVYAIIPMRNSKHMKRHLVHTLIHSLQTHGKTFSIDNDINDNKFADINNFCGEFQPFVI